MHSWERITEEILGYTPPHSLRDRLDRINNLCRNAGGMLKSRQVIAMIIAQHEFDTWIRTELAELKQPD